jgi:hypothetical protein
MDSKRKNPRLYFNIPGQYEVLPANENNIPPELARVFQRVHPNEEGAGKKINGRLKDLSSTGAFIAGEPPPLLARVGLLFGIPGFAKVEAIAWVLWRRIDSVTCDGEELAKGFGLLFEYLSPEARLHIERLVTMQNASEDLDPLLVTLLE